jgi:general secretion pathway protein K
MTRSARTRSPARQTAPPRARQRGAALLLAMLIVTIVATLAVAMIWQQWRGIEVESAERERAQGTWLLNGALDWARLILREDARNGGPDHLGEPWATPLAESRLSTFLSNDPNHASDDSGPDAFMSGQITDATAKYNLQNLVDDDPAQATKDLAGFKRLCDALSLPSDTASRIAQNFRLSSAAIEDVDANAPGEKAGRNALIVPTKVSELSWYGIEPQIITTLEPYVVILPIRTQVNANTAPAPVLMAAVDGLDRGTAERIVQQRQGKPFQGLPDVQALVPATVQITNTDVAVNSSWFEVTGQLRFEEHVLRQRTLVKRQGLDVNVVRTERLAPEAP